MNAVGCILLPLVAACAVGCAGAEPGPVEEKVCSEAEARTGRRVCVHVVRDEETWREIGFDTVAVDTVRTTTYLFPAREDSRLAPLFVDASAFENPEQSLHYQFLTTSFPEFEALEYEEYLALIQPPQTREWFAGSVTEYVTESEHLMGFVVSDPAESLATTVTCEQFQWLHRNMARRVEAGGRLVVVPAHDLQREVLATCDVPQYDPSAALDYEVYTNASGCGTVRRYTLSELASAEQRAEFGFQDVLVVDQAPLDVASVVSGIVTGTRQGELSHLNVRSASRGTPNCFVQNAHELLAEWEGQLVRLECGVAGATIQAIDSAEAEACWEALRPDAVVVAAPDRAWSDFVGLLELPTETPDERRAAVGRYGSKGVNLATLYQRIDPGLQYPGFLIPLHYYDQYVDTTSWTVDLGAGPETLTFAETIDRLLADAAFRTDGALRRERLLALSTAMRAGPCDPVLVDALSTLIVDTWGVEDIMVRFRSSSNAEDALGFNGAGLYDSTSVCLADETDADTLGPSLCDAQNTNERDVCRGLTKVWASLWNVKAYEEREFYGIDHREVAMGILVNSRTQNERANIVAFSENPLRRGDRRYLVNAQLGELDVVAAVPGVWPEKSLLTMDGATLVEVERARGSTELPEGEHVLDDARLAELGAALFGIVEVYPIDEEVPVGTRVILDTEWKLTEEGRLVVKQVRPFADD